MEFYHLRTTLFAVLLAICSSSPALAQVSCEPPLEREPWRFILPEQRCLEVRSTGELPQAAIPQIPRPLTVGTADYQQPGVPLSLSDAINTSLQNLEIVRVLGGQTATNSGRSIYDVAIANTGIDVQRGNFDPNLSINQSWNRDESADLFPFAPRRRGGYNFDLGLSKRTLTGGVLSFNSSSADTRLRPGVLDESNTASSSLSYTQPLLRGAGADVNVIPIVLARIDTDRSYFRYKLAVQQHVQGVISAYWQLVLARTVLWARERQVEQLEFALEQAEARLETGDQNLGQVAQIRVSYESFRATLIAAQSDLLNREAALRSILGFPPSEQVRFEPNSPLIDQQLTLDWEEIIELAEERRPDLIELKLILEADCQRLVLSRNQALPQLDGVALYRWDGLSGTLPSGVREESRGDLQDWNLGINFSVPLGLRRDRALLRELELIIRRDRANLDQGLLQAVHLLALRLRNLDQFYKQYEQFTRVREAARQNLEQQIGASQIGSVQVIVALQAIVDWGNAIQNEATSLIQYNTELANLEFETGTILETHGITFFEERYGSIGPLGRWAELQCYPKSIRPTTMVDRYSAGDQPSEEFFDLQAPKAQDDSVDEDARRQEAEELRKAIERAESIGVGQSTKPEPVKPPMHVRAARAIKGLFR